MDTETPQDSASEVVKELKGITAYELRKKHPRFLKLPYSTGCAGSLRYRGPPASRTEGAGQVQEGDQRDAEDNPTDE
jgi:hypothetical protein